eukprot:UN01655
MKTFKAILVPTTDPVSKKIDKKYEKENKFLKRKLVTKRSIVDKETELTLNHESYEVELPPLGIEP